MLTLPKLTPRQYLIGLALIVVFAIVTRFYRLADPPTYMFDEVYHAVTAKLIARNDVRDFEWWNPPVEPNTAVDWLHPPLAKYTQALGMLVFGENSFGWRVSSAVFGVLVVIAVAQLARELFDDEWVSLLAALLVSLDGLILTQSRIAMNDIHVTFWIVITVICYLRYKKTAYSSKSWWPGHPGWALATGLSIGLSMGSKWSGLFVMGVIGLAELWRLVPKLVTDWPQWHKRWSKWLKIGGTLFVLWVVLPLIIYVSSYWFMFAQGKSLICSGSEPLQGQCYCSQTSSWWVTGLSNLVPSQTAYWQSLEARGGCKRLISHFSELHHQIWWYQTTLKATHNYQSRPWQWFLDWKPVWYHVEYHDQQIANVYAFGNPALFWLGDLAVVATAILLLKAWGQSAADRKKSHLPLASLAMVSLAYWLVWLPWQLSPRIMFFYHYTPAIPFLAITLAFWLIWFIRRAKHQRWLAWVAVAAVIVIAVVFVVWYPNWTAQLVPIEFANKVYFGFKNWK